jgi:predicted DCC family thiol-disulfide oxidoreductase YuxK
MTLLHGETTFEVRRLFTVWVAAIWLLHLALEPLTDLAGIPPGLFRPVAPVGWLPHRIEVLFLEPVVLHGLRILGVVSLLVAAIRERAPVALVVAAIVLTLAQSIVRSLGHVNHAELPALYAVYALAFVAVLERLRGRSRALDALPLVVTAAALTTTYSLTAVFRLAHGGLAVYTTGSMVEWSAAAAFQPDEWRSQMGLLTAYDVVRWPLLLSFPLVTLFELAAPYCLISRTFRLLFVPIVVAFHVATLLFMNIFFWENVALMPFLTAWPHRFAPRAVTDGRHPIVFFDGVCGLCNRFVDYMMARDRLALFRFATLQSAIAAERLGAAALAEDSIALVDGAHVYRRSDAVLRAVSRLGGVFAAAQLLRIVPVRLRDAVYDFVAARRYKVFGRSETCRLPSPEERARFLF